MEVDNSNVKQKIYECLSTAYKWLFSIAQTPGYWTDVRSTSLVALCLELREPDGSPWLKAVKKWLLKQQVLKGDNEGSWGDELWDTSMALIALSRLGLPQKNPHVKKALNYIKNVYEKNKQGDNWHYEPWETSWCILAILETDSSSERMDIAYNAAKWLMSLQKEGEIVSPHYTAYFILIASKLKIRQEGKEEFNTAVTEAAKYLIDNIKEETLWTGEGWSNGQILWALASTKHFPCNNNEILLQTVKWFYKWFFNGQKEDNNREDAEDIASSILGLYYLLREVESQRISDTTDPETRIRNALHGRLRTPPPPRLIVKERLEDKTTLINIFITPRHKKLVAIIVAIASTVIGIIQLWDFLIGLLMR